MNWFEWFAELLGTLIATCARLADALDVEVKWSMRRD